MGEEIGGTSLRGRGVCLNVRRHNWRILLRQKIIKATKLPSYIVFLDNADLAISRNISGVDRTSKRMQLSIVNVSNAALSTGVNI
jgi:hypothetical protein